VRLKALVLSTENDAAVEAVSDAATGNDGVVIATNGAALVAIGAD
jgi:hypothetical protein